MKTPEEIKKGLSCCLEYSRLNCKKCPYVSNYDCLGDLNIDALKLIRQYEERLIND